MTDKSIAAATYIRFLLSHLDTSPSALAKRAGISSTTLTRLLNNPNYKFEPSLSTLNKLQKATNISYVSFLEAENFVEMGQAPMNSITGFKFKKDHDSQGGTTILGTVCNGLWYETTVPRYNQTGLLLLGMPFREDIGTFAFYVKGNGCNNLASDGFILMCSDIKKMPLQEGEAFVVVERYMEEKKFVELSAMAVSVSGSKATYRSCSNDPNFEQIEVTAELGDFTRLKPIGLIFFVVKALLTLGNPPQD